MNQSEPFITTMEMNQLNLTPPLYQLGVMFLDHADPDPGLRPGLERVGPDRGAPPKHASKEAKLLTEVLIFMKYQNMITWCQH